MSLNAFRNLSKIRLQSLDLRGTGVTEADIDVLDLPNTEIFVGELPEEEEDFDEEDFDVEDEFEDEFEDDFVDEDEDEVVDLDFNYYL